MPVRTWSRRLDSVLKSELEQAGITREDLYKAGMNDPEFIRSIWANEASFQSSVRSFTSGKTGLNANSREGIKHLARIAARVKLAGEPNGDRPASEPGFPGFPFPGGGAGRTFAEIFDESGRSIPPPDVYDEIRAEVARQDVKYGPYEGTSLGRSRLALATLEDETAEALKAWRGERNIEGWRATRVEVVQVAAAAARALRDAL